MPLFNISIQLYVIHLFPLYLLILLYSSKKYFMSFKCIDSIFLICLEYYVFY